MKRLPATSRATIWRSLKNETLAATFSRALLKIKKKHHCCLAAVTTMPHVSKQFPQASQERSMSRMTRCASNQFNGSEPQEHGCSEDESGIVLTPMTGLNIPAGNFRPGTFRDPGAEFLNTNVQE